ncbi:dihydrofolate reductase [Pseudarcicella hirudinis]|uniref:Dihydrofolate reductase n=1 Tax=Pseudarcicella hirudinis TaxID=1079859 RepID=A0A1I5U9V4_9BACT|nr:dihydrofolate reductase [Pseudarcicella hirudinis]SFP92069.1 dihydrofolate reductase [Pseudarcicella hirudinis]
MKLSIVVAVAENGVIGHENQLIWHLPKDLKIFKNLTTGHPIIMGRKTFDSIGKPLPNRTSIIVSRNKELAINGCIVVNSVEEAIEEAKKIEEEEAFIIGGAELYKLSLPNVDKIYLSEVKHSFAGDTFFPEIDKTVWKEISRETYLKDEKNLYDFDFVELVKEV